MPRFINKEIETAGETVGDQETQQQQTQQETHQSETVLFFIYFNLSSHLSLQI